MYVLCGRDCFVFCSTSHCTVLCGIVCITTVYCISSICILTLSLSKLCSSLSASPAERKLFLTQREGVKASIIDGKAISKYIRSQLSREVKQLVKTCGRCPSLAVILVGDDPGSRTYVGAKTKAARKVGIAERTIHLPETVSEVCTYMGCYDGILGAVVGYWVL